MSARPWRRCAALVLLGLFVVSACAREPLHAELRRSPPPDDGEYTIGPEDVLFISVWKNEALSRTVPVRPDGKISLPLLNDVQAAGLTPARLRDVLAKRLREYIPNPEVAVTIQEVRSAKVSVLGEVRTPGRYELKSATTVLDILAEAGGLGEFAARSRIVILRPDGNTTKRLLFDYDNVVAAGSEEENFYLKPGDIVLVP
jgi:polysaccharide export outer membrane protein